jgi:hypothetical protein
MGHMTGMVKIGNYAGAANDSAAVQVLLDLIGSPDETRTNGRNAGSNLDEMSPIARAQLRVELLALQDAVDTTNTL